MPRKPHCKIHTETVLCCPKCLYIERGRKGGAVRSLAQSEAARVAMQAINARKKLAGKPLQAHPPQAVEDESERPESLR